MERRVKAVEKQREDSVVEVLSEVLGRASNVLSGWPCPTMTEADAREIYAAVGGTSEEVQAFTLRFLGEDRTEEDDAACLAVANAALAFAEREGTLPRSVTRSEKLLGNPLRS